MRFHLDDLPEQNGDPQRNYQPDAAPRSAFGNLRLQALKKDPMIRSIRAATLLVVGVSLIACSSTLRTNGDAADLAALQQVVEAFRSSIVKKDKTTFMNLFFSDKPEMITWQAVVDDPSLQWIRQTRPQALKARHRSDNNFVSFIDGIVASAGNEEEKFSDINIDTDGEVASISFNYVYVADGRPTNHGREKWLLVRTEQGWKITSVVYTIRLAEVASGT